MSCRAPSRVPASLLRILPCLLCAAVVSFTASAKQEEGKSKLASLEITGSAAFHSDAIAAAIGLHVDGDVSRDQLQQAADTLAQLGIFATVKYRYDSDAAGVHAQYAVTDAPLIPVSFDNFPWFSDDEIAAAITATVHLFNGKAPERGSLLDIEANTIAALLSSRGIGGTVSHALVQDPITGTQLQQFRAEGADVPIASVRFSDALAANSQVIQQRLGDLLGRPYSRSALELFEAEQLRPLYLAAGYLQARFEPPIPRLSPVTANTLSRLDVTVPIDSGASFVWGGVSWTGDLVISPFEFDTLVQLRRGDRADGMKIDATWQAVRDAYAAHGYLDATLSISPGFDDASKRVSYSVAIAQGPQYRMGKLALSGLSVEGERRVRAAWKISAGDVFDKSEYDRFISSGISQALSGIPFHYEKLGRFLQEDPNSHTVDVLIDFQ